MYFYCIIYLYLYLNQFTVTCRSQNFLGGPDEEWFRLVHIEIEAKAGPALAAIMPMREAVRRGDVDGVAVGLRTIASVLQTMQATLSRMEEKCDPYIYYHRRVRRSVTRTSIITGE